ncbi:MAG: VWA domain-containing protein [Acidimicrobiales bacterium]
MLVGTMNPEEGSLRPQLLDRFGLCVEVVSPTDAHVRAEIIRRRIRFDADPVAFGSTFDEGEAALAARIASARLATVPDALMEKVAILCVTLSLSGMRGDITCCKAAAALAGFEGRTVISDHDIIRVASLTLSHRRKRDPLSDGYVQPDEMDAALAEVFGSDIHQPLERSAIQPGSDRRGGNSGGNSGDEYFGDNIPGGYRPADDGSGDGPAGDGPAGDGPAGDGSDGEGIVRAAGDQTYRDHSTATFTATLREGDEGPSLDEGLRQSFLHAGNSDDDGNNTFTASEIEIGGASARVSITYPDPSDIAGMTGAARRTGHFGHNDRSNGKETNRGSPPTGGQGPVVRYVPLREYNDVASNGNVALPKSIAAAALRQIDDRDGAGATAVSHSTDGRLALGMKREDLRVEETRTHRPRLVVFGLDTSGSMGVGQRIEFARGAVESLLYESYKRRDRVTLISFHGSSAQVALNPTGSLEVARSRIMTMETGGRTPLASGISKMSDVMLSAIDRGYSPLGVLVSDGRATFSPTGTDPHKEALYAANRVKAAHLQSIVVDTARISGNGPALDLAGELARAMGARLIRIAEAEADPGQLFAAISDY